MAEEKLSPLLRWYPWHRGDPAPEIWSIIQELEVSKQREIAAIVLRTQIAIEEAHIAGLKQIAGVLGSGGR